MNPILYTVIMTILWIANLLNDSGLGQVYQTTQKFRLLIIFIFLLIVIFKFAKNKKIILQKKDMFIFGGMFFIFGSISYLTGNKQSGLNYLYVFLLIYVMSKIEVKEFAARFVGITYLCLGMGVIYIYGHSAILSGWNGNTIGMLGFYSFLIFLIQFYDTKNIKSKVLILIVTLLYINLIGTTDSRSSIFFAVLTVLFALSFISRDFIIASPNRYYFWLLIPLIVAIIVVIFSKGSYMQLLNHWSIAHFKKPIFNGRDELWDTGFKLFKAHFFIGTGSLKGNWHNCIISILTTYGLMGTVCWILSFQNILKKGYQWINDTIICGCTITFLMMFIQQSVELGLLAENPNLLPYIVLGMMLGRVKYLNNSLEERHD